MSPFDKCIDRRSRPVLTSHVHPILYGLGPSFGWHHLLFTLVLKCVNQVLYKQGQKCSFRTWTINYNLDILQHLSYIITILAFWISTTCIMEKDILAEIHISSRTDLTDKHCEISIKTQAGCSYSPCLTLGCWPSSKHILN